MYQLYFAAVVKETKFEVQEIIKKRAFPLFYIRLFGGMAEWSGGGLQILLPQFKSGCRLIYKKWERLSFFAQQKQ